MVEVQEHSCFCVDETSACLNDVKNTMSKHESKKNAVVGLRHIDEVWSKEEKRGVVGIGLKKQSLELS